MPKSSLPLHSQKQKKKKKLLWKLHPFIVTDSLTTTVIPQITLYSLNNPLFQIFQKKYMGLEYIFLRQNLLKNYFLTLILPTFSGSTKKSSSARSNQVGRNRSRENRIDITSGTCNEGKGASCMKLKLPGSSILGNHPFTFDSEWFDGWKEQAGGQMGRWKDGRTWKVHKCYFNCIHAKTYKNEWTAGKIKQEG